MPSNKLKSEIESYLRNADKLWVAVALVKDSGFDFVQRHIKNGCTQYFLVGIDLPTPVSVLRKLKDKQRSGFFECVIYKSNSSFHPKVYLIKSGNEYTAFVGSSNLTEGGLEDNVEINYKVTNQKDCINLLNWFNSLYRNGYPLTNENINEYESQLESIKGIEERLKRKRGSIVLKKPNKIKSVLDDIDFSDRYFKKEHHLAFRKELWYSDVEAAIEERELARERFIELHNTIFPLFKNFGIQVLQHNPRPEHLISMIHQIDPTNPRAINAMWLGYGKSEREIKMYQNLVGADQKAKQTFIHHARLQIRIDLEKINIWLLFAKENEGGIFDRAFFKRRMREVEYGERFFNMIRSLPDDYFISVGGEKKFCTEFSSTNDLHAFCKKDNIKDYFILGKDYNISDGEMSETNLPNETLRIFKLLFPFYETMRDRTVG